MLDGLIGGAILVLIGVAGGRYLTVGRHANVRGRMIARKPVTIDESPAPSFSQPNGSGAPAGVLARGETHTRKLTVAPEPGRPFTDSTALSVIGLEVELNLQPRCIQGRIVDASLTSGGNIEMFLEMNAAEGEVEFLDDFRVRICRAWMS
jgi:hypothetical protein